MVTPSDCVFPSTEGGWTVIQRRMDGSVDFDQLWDAYKNGFGDLRGRWMMVFVFSLWDKGSLAKVIHLVCLWDSLCWTTDMG